MPGTIARSPDGLVKTDGPPSRRAVPFSAKVVTPSSPTPTYKGEGYPPPRRH